MFSAHYGILHLFTYLYNRALDSIFTCLYVTLQTIRPGTLGGIAERLPTSLAIATHSHFFEVHRVWYNPLK